MADELLWVIGSRHSRGTSDGFRKGRIADEVAAMTLGNGKKDPSVM